MSAPNKSYDPVEVAALEPEAVAAAVTAALAAIAAAADLDALKQARLAHAGDRSPLALANREIGALPPHAQGRGRQAGREPRGRHPSTRRGAPDGARGRARRPRAGRGGRRRHAAVGPPAARRPAPADHDHGARRRRLRRHGLRGRRRPRGRGGVVQLRRAEHRPGPPGALDAGHVLRRAGPSAGVVLRTHTSPVQIRTLLEPRAADLRRLPRPGVPHRRARRHAHARSSTRSRGSWSTRASRWPTSRARSTTSRPAMFGAGPDAPGCARPTSRSPSRAPRSTCCASSAAARRSATPTRPCRTCCSEGWIEWGGCGMVNPRVLVACGIDPDELQRLRVRHGHRADADVPPRRHRHARHGRGRRPVHPAFGMEI